MEELFVGGVLFACERKQRDYLATPGFILREINESRERSRTLSSPEDMFVIQFTVSFLNISLLQTSFPFSSIASGSYMNVVLEMCHY